MEIARIRIESDHLAEVVSKMRITFLTDVATEMILVMQAEGQKKKKKIYHFMSVGHLVANVKGKRDFIVRQCIFWRSLFCS